jgi:enoyl-CoA hydratase/carnithine racemase
VIAAINGVVAGFSLDLVTEADIPIASENASFLDPHVSIGYVSSHEMVNMARRVPVAVCMRMALLGSRERMSAQRAYEVGLITEVVAHDKLMDRARELAEMIKSNAPLAVWGTKLGILQGLGLPIPQAEEIAAGYLQIVEQSEDHKEGPRSFVEKRKPNWQGK